MTDPVTGAFIEEVGKPKAPEPTTGRNSKGWKAWKDKRDEAAAVIVERIDPDQCVHIKGIDDHPLAMWEALASYHTVKGLGSVVSVYKHLMAAQKDDLVTISAHVKTIRAGLLESLGEPITPSFIVSCILVSLTNDYQPIILKLDGDHMVSDIDYVTA
ncbi:hypothetical protein GGU10DRAFT_279437 [Lentinula aff. detonsa]|uniref:Uncharacterized protein n=1 Tax=Lentinula aff. detonsa TaxID=2804958 RepID=A0AA38KTD7_9AGAR|nr:hypothetical protein GGU10DRAFT_279437 [Lentinula aff. detonsa]